MSSGSFRDDSSSDWSSVTTPGDHSSLNGFNDEGPLARLTSYSVDEQQFSSPSETLAPTMKFKSLSTSCGSRNKATKSSKTIPSHALIQSTTPSAALPFTTPTSISADQRETPCRPTTSPSAVPFTAVPASTSFSKPSSTLIKRPMNSWILYRSETLKNLKAGTKDSSNLTQADISKTISLMWKNETPSVRSRYEKMSEEMKTQHLINFPDYKYQPVSRVQKLKIKEEKIRMKEERTQLLKTTSAVLAPRCDRSTTALPKNKPKKFKKNPYQLSLSPTLPPNMAWIDVPISNPDSPCPAKISLPSQSYFTSHPQQKQKQHLDFQHHNPQHTECWVKDTSCSGTPLLQGDLSANQNQYQLVCHNEPQPNFYSISHRDLLTPPEEEPIYRDLPQQLHQPPISPPMLTHSQSLHNDYNYSIHNTNDCQKSAQDLAAMWYLMDDTSPIPHNTEKFISDIDIELEIEGDLAPITVGAGIDGQFSVDEGLLLVDADWVPGFEYSFEPSFDTDLQILTTEPFVTQKYLPPPALRHSASVPDLQQSYTPNPLAQ